ncbi:hypothetical protein O6H91_09G029600 [Diphasiastrum complanatum]|uniref:Uncharacterized protein n=11 Tax=Diphasiastrum complanatum TaxID=34168 RepID=A0ACC2CNE7_DIPCM|nr:hypothetical protein O6H91_09G029600 [Diphasiastrum complanatum]KAJ7543205.1 hypothetical protein O6H91_09G029600 [Diphasiastrum complanatum]KAJ7543206.1 hypothetical protein O6H91_09G029600 [Diphasiastrum complanatum]KAJ7543207.1 hypothetical protein O6H91_09G029600 [Diphasiastrum complanatum]KAJ7543208.1 hypothetical protein O6H91_09G029600 [Diphasiastrum complanatum]
MEKESGALAGDKVSQDSLIGFQPEGATLSNPGHITTRSTDTLITHEPLSASHACLWKESDKLFLANERGCQQALVSNKHGLTNAHISSASPSEISPSFNSTMTFLSSFSSPSLPTSSWGLPMEGSSEQAVGLEEGHVPSVYGEAICTEGLSSDLDFRESDGHSGVTENAGTNACLGPFRSEQLNRSFQLEMMQSTEGNHANDIVNTICPTQMIDPVQLKGDGSRNAEKAHMQGPSLRYVLSDPITGSFMDDAMVSICGHSFGGAGLQQVLETSICMNCGASIPSGSLVPNHALREAVEAYKREEYYWHNSSNSFKRSREHSEQPEAFEGKKTNLDSLIFSEGTGMEGSFKLRGVQFPFSLNDHVLIKGNKRTPERFVGREAIITTQCLNGWYLVRTLDNGENVRLQYRSLQKLNPPTAPELKASVPSEQEADTGKRVNTEICIKKDSPIFKPMNDGMLEKGRISNQRESHSVSSFVSMPMKGFKTDFTSKTSCRPQKGDLVYLNETQAVSAMTSARTSSNSSQELSVNQFQSIPRCSSDNMERSSFYEPNSTNMLDDIYNAESLAKNMIKGGRYGTITQPDTFTLRSKRSALNARSPSSQETAGLVSDPYRKVYTSASRRRGISGNNHATLFTERLLPGFLDNKKLELTDSGRAVDTIASKVDKTRTTEGNKPTSKGLHKENPAKLMQIIRKDILKLERYLPWSCFHWSWREHRLTWRNGARKSSTIKELGTQLEKLHASLLLSSVSRGPIDKWESRSGFNDIQLLVCSWKRLYDDMQKWLKEQHKDVQGTHMLYFQERKDLQIMFPELFTNSTSPVSTVPAATLPDATVYRDQNDNNDLVAIRSTLTQQQSQLKLAMIREALEREQRYTIARLAQLEGNGSIRSHVQEKVDNEETITNSVENSNHHMQLTGLQSAMIAPSELLHRNVNKNTKCKEIVQTADTNGESTDMSDSD